MPKSLVELVTAKSLATYWNVKASQRAPYFGESKFPAKKKLGLDLSYIKGARKAPVKLSLSAFDAKVVPLNRGEITKMASEMPFFKNSKNIDEKQRQELNILLGNAQNQDAVNIVINDIFNDKMALVEDALLTLEIMRMQALTTGAVAISSNGQKFGYDYQIPAENKVTPAVKWDDFANADPVSDINDWLDAIEARTGVRPTEAVLNSTTLGYLKKCDAIKNAVYFHSDSALKIPNMSAKTVLKHLFDETGVTFYVYSKNYEDDGKQVKFVADGTVVFMPETAVGNTWFGTTPEESDLMADPTAQVEIVETGVAITTTKQTDPVNVQTKVSMIALPSLELADNIIIASVKTAG